MWKNYFNSFTASIWYHLYYGNCLKNVLRFTFLNLCRISWGEIRIRLYDPQRFFLFLFFFFNERKKIFINKQKASEMSNFFFASMQKNPLFFKQKFLLAKFSCKWYLVSSVWEHLKSGMTKKPSEGKKRSKVFERLFV